MTTLTPRIGQRFKGVSETEVQSDPVRNNLITHLVKYVLNHPSKEKPMQKFQNKNFGEYQPMSESAKNMIKSQDNVEASELCELLSNVQYPQCLQYSVNSLPQPKFTRTLLHIRLPNPLYATLKFMVDSHRISTGDLRFLEVSYAFIIQLLENKLQDATSSEPKIRNRNFEARTERTASGLPAQ